MSKVILTVDDSKTMRNMLMLALTDAGYTVVQAEDGVHGTEVLGTNAAVDLGYQFTASPQTTHPDAQSLAEDRGLNYHQVKLGFRYDLW